ncbi:MAG: ABC transporter ATP-binding protein/permease [Treponema sp.]|nr:ABC transporter ATP-binding protein/permease [Treponema sp.]
MKVNVLIPTIRKMYGLLSRKHRVYWGLMILLSIGFSLVETIGISAIMPFISVASNPDLLDSGIYKRLFDIVGVQERETFIILFGIAIIVFYIFRAVYSIIHAYLISRFSNALFRYFATKIFSVTLSVPYAVYAQKNSGEIMGIINGETGQMSRISMDTLKLFTELLTIFMVYTLLIVINWQMTLILTLVLVFLAIIFFRILVFKSKSLGVRRVEADRKTFRLLMEALGNFKFVRLKGNGNELVDTYNRTKLKVTQAIVAGDTLNATPKSVLESMGFSILVAAVILILAQYSDASMVIPIISMYALALFRILPCMHRLFQNINGIAFAQHSLNTIAEMIQQPTENEGNEPIAFNEAINLRNVSFKYASGNEVIHNVSLTIRKGEKIAVTGESGGGKSTLIDLVIGIHKPYSGEIVIDDRPLCEQTVRSWRSKIGYIPQSIYLFDGTVGENVAYGSKMEEEKIKTALQKANIWDFLLTKEGIDTKVGEGGIQLSGGQQQRIGIARALYNNPEILVLDEATSALDNETEKKIMNEIYHASENKTLIVIAHRLSTVERCDRAIRIENGEVFY